MMIRRTFSSSKGEDTARNEEETKESTNSNSPKNLRQQQQAAPGIRTENLEKNTEENQAGRKNTKKDDHVLNLLPGLGLSTATAIGGFSAATWLSSSSVLAIPISGIPVSILLGMGIKNMIGYDPATYKPGITFATKTVLQCGIVCVAAKLSFVQLLHSCTAGIPVVLASVGTGLYVLPRLGAMAGLPHRMSLLLTAGTSICGVTAITALAPAIHASNRDVAVAVANTVLFGTVGMLLYPYLFHHVCASSEQIGMCLGVAIHDTSQVLGSALAYKETYGDDVAFQMAAVTKLMRNLGLAVAIPLLSYQHHAAVEATASQKKVGEGGEAPSPATTTTTTTTSIYGLNTFSKYVPPFLVAFLGMSAFRSGGDYFLLQDVNSYTDTMNFIGNDLSKYALGTAMAGVGLSTDKSSLRGVGWKPFAVGLSGALVVGGTGFTVAMLTV